MWASTSIATGSCNVSVLSVTNTVSIYLTTICNCMGYAESVVNLEGL